LMLGVETPESHDYAWGGGEYQKLGGGKGTFGRGQQVREKWGKAT